MLQSAISRRTAHSEEASDMDQPKQPDHEGLQWAAPTDAPEVVSNQSPQRPWNGLKRHSSLNSPEAFTPGEHDPHGAKQTGGFYDGRAQYAQQPPGYHSEAEKHPANPEEKRRVCGMRRTVFIWVLVLVALVVVIAAVLGGVLGTVLKGSKSSSKSTSSPSATSTGSGSSPSPSSTPSLSLNSNTGLSVTNPDGTSALYSYYQDTKGRIVEDEYKDGSWSIQGDNIPSAAVIATDAQPGSPLAATSYTNDGTLFRQVFYLNGNGLVMTSNTTGTNPWSQSYNILIADSAANGSVALAVVSNTDSSALNGIRVYYASVQGWIQECGMDFDVDPVTWNMWGYWPGSDITSGVTSVLDGSDNHLYFRNLSTGKMQQWLWEYNDPTSWEPAASGPSDFPSNAGIAAANDGAGVDHIFYQNADGNLIRTLYYSDAITGSESIASTPSGSKIAATYYSTISGEGALVYYKNASRTDAISYVEVNRNGDTVLKGVVQ